MPYLSVPTLPGVEPTTKEADGRRPPMSSTRRRALTWFAAASVARPFRVAFATEPPPAERLWLTLFTGTAGGPVFWLTRGTEFIVVDGAATPVKGRVSAIAAMAKPREGGDVRVSYLLQGCTVTPTGFDFVPELIHPITGEALSTAPTPPLKLGWTLAANGDLSEELVAANGTRAIYRGTTWASPGSGAERTATLDMHIRLERPNGDIETFTEISRTRPRPPSAAPSPADTFIAAESETFTTRALPDPPKYRGKTAMSMSMNHGINYRSVDELRRDLRNAESTALGAFFEQLPGWVRER